MLDCYTYSVSVKVWWPACGCTGEESCKRYGPESKTRQVRVLLCIVSTNVFLTSTYFRLREIEMSEHDGAMYDSMIKRVHRQVKALRVMLDSLHVSQFHGELNMLIDVFGHSL